MNKQIFDRTKKLMCIFTLVFFVLSLTAASASAQSTDTYKVEKAKLDAEKAKFVKEKVVILKEKAELEKEKQKLESQKKTKTDKEYQTWLTNYNKCLSKYKTWEANYNKCLNDYKVLEAKCKK